MHSTFKAQFTLFISCFILLLANGLINLLLPVRMSLDGAGIDTIGMVLSLYFVGMLLGALLSINLIKRAGHIRVFAGCVALAAIAILICSLYTEPFVWGAMRLVTGFCNACAFTAMESWLSSSSTKETRGKTLGVYNAVLLGGLFSGQFFMNLADPTDTTLFVVAGILLCAAVIPLVLSRNPGPIIEEVSSMSLRALYKISPLGVVCCFVSGMIYSASFNLLPIFAGQYNIVDFELSLYVGTAILGAFILQFPVGYLSDRYDRRTVLFGLLIISALADLAIPQFAKVDNLLGVFTATAITCGIIACTYPLSISEAFDRLRQNQMVAAMGAMIFTFAAGGVIGPYAASVVMNTFGSVFLFYFLALIQLLLAGFVIYRMTVRKALPIEDQESFVMQGAEFFSGVDLDPRTEFIEPEKKLSVEEEITLSIAESDPASAVKMTQVITKHNPTIGLNIAKAVAATESVNVLRLHEVLKDTIPEKIIDVTRALITAQPELADELIQQLAQWYPEQMVQMVIAIAHSLPELRAEIISVLLKLAPEAVTKIKTDYAAMLVEERQTIRPADRTPAVILR
ncbi:MFS transporter [Pseudoalteromonas sp. K222D]|uniref:MFS transporter n=1 Tax=Pseudoalteromonas sp. K222D TaxID=2820756 RepID=UPI001AD6637F|nr:MFS transporter [Pseudoalteromonas sp. K222D]MBO7927141.1 MFS transporter [Pseudoalteromonas sp. K222D]